LEPLPKRPEVRLAHNATLNLIGQLLPVLVALATMPVVVRGLGAARFGVLALAWTAVGYVAVFDLGFGRATTKRVSEAFWAGDYHRIRGLAATAAMAQLAIGLLTGGTLWLLAPALARLLLSTSSGVTEGAAVLGILAAAVPAVLLSNAYRAVLEGLHRFDLVNAARAPLSAAMFVVPFVGVVAGWSLTSIIIGLALTRWFGAAVFFGIYARTAPQAAASARVAGQRTAELKDLVRFGGWVAVSNSIIPLTFYLERFIITALRGPIALAYYAAPHELIWKLHLIPSAVAGVLFPTFSGLSAGGQRSELLRRIGQGTRLIILLVAPAAAVLILVATPLLSVWLGADYGTESAGVLRLLAVAVFLNSAAFIPFVLIEGIGRPATIARYHLLELPLYAGLLWWLITHHGILGAALAAALRMLIMVTALSAAAMRHAGLTLEEALPGASRRCVAAAAGLLGLAYVGSVTIQSAWLQSAAGALLLLGFGFTAWLLLLEPDDRAILRSMWCAIRRQRAQPPVPQPPAATQDA
jgi:O-antigen/teichoic acid export membrane protein